MLAKILCRSLLAQQTKYKNMLENIILWTICAIFIGLVGYLLEANLKKSVYTNIFASFFGMFSSCFFVHFLIWPVPSGEINIVAAVVGMVVAYVCVNLEDNIFRVPY